MFADVLSHGRARFGEQGIGFGSSFDRPGLNPTGAVTDTLLGDEEAIAGVWQLNRSIPSVVLMLRRSSSTCQRLR
jgi:hypothetical protein